MSQTQTLKLENGQSIELSTTEVDQTNDFDTIPVLDLTDLFSGTIEERRKVAEEFKEMATNVGFLYIKNHGIPDEIVDGIFDAAKKFFALPLEEKMKVYTGLVPVNQTTGYHPLSQYNRTGNKLNDLSEAFNINYDGEYDPIPPPTEKAEKSFKNMWPEALPEMKGALMLYHTECLKLARRLIQMVVLAFGLDEHHLDDAVQVPSVPMRILHYPVQEASAEDQNGIGPHTDFQLLTLLNPGDISGLQVLNQRGQWVDVPPIPGTIVVNVADCLTRITNGIFRSTVHRVVNHSGKERYSIPFFFGFDADYPLVPVPGCVTEENPQKYPVVTSGEYIAWRAKLSKGLANIKD